MSYRFEFRRYQRRFKLPLQTSYGSWDVREGIILRLTDEVGNFGYGEIAPISWFGSESMAQAGDFCCQLPEEITDEMIFSIPEELSACRFGFESAKESNRQSAKYAKEGKSLRFSGLLAAGEKVLDDWRLLWEQGYRTFKWKIGVYPVAEELEVFQVLVEALPREAKLRLDANGGLSYDDANLWLESCDQLSGAIVEFIEQPLSVGQFAQMQELSCCYRTAIALDESVATLKQLEGCYRQGWRGVFVIKPCIVGSPSRLRQFCQQYQVDAVFSSVFETTVGRVAALRLASELSFGNRAVGFGVNHWFDDEESWLQQLWNH